MKKMLCLLLAAVCLLCCAAPVFAAEGYGNFRKVAAYHEGLFYDVHSGEWFEESVGAAYELGLMKGNPDGSFNPEGNVTIAESLTMAARLHSIWHSGKAEFEASTPWYQVYADYCLRSGIVSGLPENLSAAATRAEFAAILAGALPASALPEVNEIADNAVPDVRMSAAHAQEIYRLYRAGVLRGNDEYGRFTPETPIQRSAVAAIVSRMAYRSLRLKFELTPTRYPDLAQQSTPAGEEYFADAAMIGNSLVDGMRLYSGLNMTYFGQESTNVKSYKLDKLLQGSYGKVYIELGINDMGLSLETYIDGYRTIIDRIRSVMPEAEIFVLSMTPVTKAKSTQGFAMSEITRRNEALHDLAGEMECWYIDCCTPLCGADGYLLPEYAASWDGAHLKETAGYVAWADIIRTYYA